MELSRRFRVGLGSTALAGTSRAASEPAALAREEQVSSLLRFAAERLGGAQGPAHLDTAPGSGEAALGRCFDREPGLRSRFQVATGWGLDGDRPSDAAALSLAGLGRSVEASAARLHGIDLLYLHTHSGVDPDRLRWMLRGGDGCLERMRDLRKRRVHGISQLGLALASREALARVARSPELLAGLDVLQLAAWLATEDLELAARLQSLDLALVVSASAGGFDSRALGALPEALLLVDAREPGQLAQQLAAAAEWAAPRPLELGYAGDRALASEAREIETALLRHLTPPEPDTHAARAEPAADPQAAAERIARVLIGSRKTRLGPAPTGRGLLCLQRRIADHVIRDLPVDVILTWGPRKFHAAREDNLADVAELCALARLAAFQSEVRAIHPLGLRFTLFYEDLEGAFIEGEDDAAFWRYGAGLVRLANLLGDCAGVRVLGTRGLLRRFDLAEVEARLGENHAQLRACWHGVGDPVALERLGFSGGIDATSRRFYLERLDRLLGDRRTPDQKQDMVIRLFAAVLLHRQLDMFRVRPDLEAVKLSFLALAGGPASLADGRVDVRSISADLCKHSLAPWSGKGFLRRREGEIQPAARPWPEPLPPGGRLLRGELQLRLGDASAELRADRLLVGP